MQNSIMKTILTVAFLISALTASTNILDFAFDKWRQDPEVRIEDAYKWLYQATRGGEHAAPDETMARQYLAQEWKTLAEPEPNEPLWEPLRADDKVGRLNLRPFRARGGKMDDLLAAFMRSARKFKDQSADFRAEWNALGQRLESAPLGNLTGPEWRRLDEEMAAKQYPAIHHSAGFSKSKRPAYRVLTREAAAGLIKSLDPAPRKEPGYF